MNAQRELDLEITDGRAALPAFDPLLALKTDASGLPSELRRVARWLVSIHSQFLKAS
jgi:hypothetical protein